MLCLGPKKSLPSPRLELTAQGVAYQCSKVECEDHSAIQAPRMSLKLNLVPNFTFTIQRNRLKLSSRSCFFFAKNIELNCYVFKLILSYLLNLAFVISLLFVLLHKQIQSV